MKPQGQVQVKPRLMSRAKIAHVLTAVLVGLATLVVFLNVYIVRELLLFVACAALPVFFAVNLAVLGILIHAAGVSLLQSIRKAKPGIPQGGGGNAEHARPKRDINKSLTGSGLMQAVDKQSWDPSVKALTDGNT